MKDNLLANPDNRLRVDGIRAAEDEFASMFSTTVGVNERFLRRQDGALPDMYDHNQFIPLGAVSVEDVLALNEYRKAHNDGFLKLDCRQRLDSATEEALKERLGMEGGETITMYLAEPQKVNRNPNPNVVIKDAKAEEILGDILCVELKNYAQIYGADFCRRRAVRYVEKAKTDSRMHYFAAYLEGKVVGCVYAFATKSYVQIDSLVVNEEARGQYVATALLHHIACLFEQTPFLHADAEDTPKDMYTKLGFASVDSLWEYSATFAAEAK